MHYNLVALVCIAFQYNADAMHHFFMQYQYMAIYRIVSIKVFKVEMHEIIECIRL
jgi:hypothetical protein